MSIFEVSSEGCGASIPGIGTIPEIFRANSARAPVESHREFGFLLEVLGCGVDSAQVGPLFLGSTTGFEVSVDVTNLFAADCPLYRSRVMWASIGFSVDDWWVLAFWLVL